MPETLRSYKEELSSFSRQILKRCPSYESDHSIGIKTLIERLSNLGGYADYQSIIQTLVELGYLESLPGSRVRRTPKGDSAIAIYS